MGAIGRGSSPSGGININVDEMNHTSHWYHPHWYYMGYHRYYIYDSTFYLMDIIATVIIIIVGLMIYVFTYQPLMGDPIQSIKTTYLYSQFISTGILLTLPFITSFFSKSKDTVIKNLILVLVLTVLVVIMFIGIKFIIDNTYTQERFREIYISENPDADQTLKSRVTLQGIKTETTEQIFINENLKAYNNFKVKTILGMLLYFLVIIIDIHMIIKAVKIKEKIDRLEKDDIVVYDPEQNIKI